jgi:hypothetical protein
MGQHDCPGDTTSPLVTERDPPSVPVTSAQPLSDQPVTRPPNVQQRTRVYAEEQRGDSMAETSADLVRTTFGAAPRCQAQCKATKERFGRPARRGFTVCSVHGAGTRRRELAGVRTNPRAGSLVHGGRAQQATLVALREVDAAFAAARAEVVGRPDRLRAIDEVLADLWALRRLLVQQVQLGVDEQQPSVVLQVLDSLAATIERAARIEQRLLDPKHVHIGLVNVLVSNVVAVLEKYVEPERLSEALDKLRHLQAAVTAG